MITADPSPFFVARIFRRWKDRLLDWRYRLPRLHLIEFPFDRPDGRRSYEIEKMRAELETMDDLKHKPVPAIVRTAIFTAPFPVVGRHGSSTSATIELVVPCVRDEAPKIS